ncbi:unnamed protein product [Cladocopium goreaui]|uniref:Uncharacterized protein n=1 Tax=Cladocopium goreaui TaxID=2562237 RepID=A0A9P1CYJ6_9DINO|nr:unnamed protein product [Cladocopium goreaui]
MAIQRIKDLERELRRAKRGADNGGDNDDEGDAKDDEGEDEPIKYPDGTAVISADALRMRLRRLCSLKKSGKSHVSDEVRKDYLGGGEKREWLEIALLEAIKVHGTDRKLYNRVKERQWKYNPSVPEFFVEDETTTCLRRSDLTREVATTEVEDKTSATAPDTSRLGLEIPSENIKPELVGHKVAPDLEKFMTSVQNRVNGVCEMISVLTDVEIPVAARKVGYTTLSNKLEKCQNQLEECYSRLASILTDIQMEGLDQLHNTDPKMKQFLGKY